MSGKEYIRPIPASYLFERPSWRRFVLREFTSVFIGGYAVFLLVLAYRARDEQSFAAFVTGLKSPVSILLHLITLAMVLYHTYTWFKLTPQAVPMWRGEERVAASQVVATNWIVWAIVTVVIAAIVFAVT
jgi:fumarate reductase subunit C